MRMSNSIRNIITALIGQFLGILLNFIGRKVFIDILGEAYLGVNGLFDNILSMLSLAEMGVGTAIIFSLYKPLALEDIPKIKELMNFYKKAYRVIGCVVAAIGLAIIPFLRYMIDDDVTIPYLTVIYILFLTNSVVSYFLAYKRSLIIADQKSYISTQYKYCFYVVLNISQIIMLLATKQYMLYLMLQILFTVMENITISIKADQLYPYLKEKNCKSLNAESKAEISKNVRAMMYHKIGSVFVDGTDNILISQFVGIVQVGLYSNYFIVINALRTILNQMFNAVTASIGNLNVLESKEKNYRVYRNILFLNFAIAGFCSITLFVLFNPFITIWLGKQYLFDTSLVLILVINFYLNTIRLTNLVFKTALGLFWCDRYKAIVEGIINIVVSILLVKLLGIEGIFLGTLASILTTNFWIEPYVLYRYSFQRGLGEYFMMLVKYTIVIVISACCTVALSRMISGESILQFIVKALICIVMPNCIFLLCFNRTMECKECITIMRSRGKTIISKIRRSAE